MSPTDATLEHSATPVGNIPAEAVRLNVSCAGKSADAAKFYIDDATCSEFDGGLCITQVGDGFVEADLRFDLFLQFRVCVYVVPPEWLLHHQQSKLIEAPQVLKVLKCIG